MNASHYRKALVQNLKSIRKSKGLTTVDLAKILGVSQAKISYIENEKGVLSAEDVAILSRRLDVPVTEFFRGLDQGGGGAGVATLIGQLAHYGAVLLARPSAVRLEYAPFEEVFVQGLTFLDDVRLQKALCAALITQAARKEIHVDKIFALVGNNPFLTSKAEEQADLCLKVIPLLNKAENQVNVRARQQIEKIARIAKKLRGLFTLDARDGDGVVDDVLPAYAAFVADCLDG